MQVIIFFHLVLIRLIINFTIFCSSISVLRKWESSMHLLMKQMQMKNKIWCHMIFYLNLFMPWELIFLILKLLTLRIVLWLLYDIFKINNLLDLLNLKKNFYILAKKVSISHDVYTPFLFCFKSPLSFFHSLEICQLRKKFFKF